MSNFKQKTPNSVILLFLVLLPLNSGYGPTLLYLTGILPDKPAVTVKFTVTFSRSLAQQGLFYLYSWINSFGFCCATSSVTYKYKARVGLFTHFMHFISCRLGWAEPRFQGNDYFSLMKLKRANVARKA